MKEIIKRCNESGLDESLVAEIIKICELNFYDDSTSQSKRTTQINKLIDKFSKESFENQSQ